MSNSKGYAENINILLFICFCFVVVVVMYQSSVLYSQHPLVNTVMNHFIYFLLNTVEVRLGYYVMSRNQKWKQKQAGPKTNKQTKVLGCT